MQRHINHVDAVDGAIIVGAVSTKAVWLTD
jgi:hypothetical protein